MSTPQVQSQRDAAALHIYELVKARAKRNGRFRKLKGGSTVRQAVIHEDVLRYRTILGGRDDVMRSVIDGALTRLMEQSVREGFWHEDSEERDALIDRALDAERMSYIRATAASGGTPEGGLIDHSAWDNLVRHTEGGNLDSIDFGADPALILERQEEEADREQEAAKERETVQGNLNAYSEALHLAHRKALDLICNEPTLTNKAIAARVLRQTARRISQQTVAKIRERYNVIAEPSLLLKLDLGALRRLQRRVEIVEKETAAIRAERRRDEYLRTHSVEEYEVFRNFAALFMQEGESVDGLLAATISGPKSNA